MHPRHPLALRPPVSGAMLASATVVGACLLTACTGPATVLHNPAGHRVFVDGREVATDTDTAGPQVLPFRYYGTSRWDAQPADTGDRPDWTRQPSAAPIELPPPASPWLFPLDFPLELARWAVLGRDDPAVTIELPPTPADLVVPAEVPPEGLGRLLDRGEAARIAR